jgi:phosphoglycolate phosphatase
MHKTIVWDWNGTLLNDLDICVQAMNSMLKKRNIETLTIEKYKQIFTFPVKDYYALAGIDFNVHSFDEMADEFISQYYRDLPKAGLFQEVIDVLQKFKHKGIKQVIISAMEHNALVESLKHFKIYQYFDEVIGIEDHLAKGKTHNVEHFLNRNGSGDTVMIGDTLHDCEIGNQFGIDVFLVANGHQSYERLQHCKAKVLHDLEEVTKSILCL